MLASPYPASLGHLILHQLRSAEGTLEGTLAGDLLVADPILARHSSVRLVPHKISHSESLSQAVLGRSLRQAPKSGPLVAAALALVGILSGYHCLLSDTGTKYPVCSGLPRGSVNGGDTFHPLQGVEGIEHHLEPDQRLEELCQRC